MIKKYLPRVLILFGILLRLRQYFFDRSLWLDEALLARNITERSLSGLLQPLGYDQNAPVGFLMLSKLATMIGGNTSLALRFFPLVFGITSLFLFYAIARKLLKTPGMLIALALFSLSTPMVYYSAEFKQYMGDVVATLLLWYLYFIVQPKRNVVMAVWGAIILWFSHASLFVLAGLGLADMSLWRIAVPFWLASFGGDYMVSLRYNLSDVVITKWEGHFLVFPWVQGGNIDAFMVSLNRMFGFFVDLDSSWGQMVVIFIGYVEIAKKNMKNCIVIGLPILLLLIATGFQKYPFVPRLLLFLAPSFYLAIGAGVDGILSAIRANGNKILYGIVGVSVTTLVLWGTVPSAVEGLVTPLKVEELAQVLRYLHDNVHDGDVIYVYYGAEAPFRFYAPQFAMNMTTVHFGIESRMHIEAYLKDVAELRGHARVWLVFSHIFRQSLYGEDRYIVGYLDTIGKRLDYYPQVGASLYLYDLR